jgi:hypothetical protein
LDHETPLNGVSTTQQVHDQYLFLSSFSRA